VDNRSILTPNTLQPGGSGSSYYTTAATAVVQLALSPAVNSKGKPSGTSPYPSSSSSSSNAYATSPAYLVGGFAGSKPTRSLLLDSGDALGAVQLNLQDELGQLVQPAVLQRLTITAEAAAVAPGASSDTQLIGVTSTVVSPTFAALSTGSGIDGKNSSGLHAAQTSSNLGNQSLAILFNKLQLEGAPGAKFNVTFKVQEAPTVQPAVLQVQIKPCTPGQAVKRGRDTELLAGCTNCTNPFFSFDPTYPSCSMCPPPETYAHCSGDVITPAGATCCSSGVAAGLLLLLPYGHCVALCAL
jgi:hypothetical protein